MLTIFLFLSLFEETGTVSLFVSVARRLIVSILIWEVWAAFNLTRKREKTVSDTGARRQATAAMVQISRKNGLGGKGRHTS